jgi:Protein of unknown function (DUF3617)
LLKIESSDNGFVYKEYLMRFRTILPALITVLSFPACFAADIQPGMWTLSVTNKVAALPGFAPTPYTLNQCLTEQDAKDPSRVLGGLSNPGASDCVYTDKSYSGNTFRFKMQCAGSLGMHASGEVSYSATSLQGNISSTSSMNDQTIKLDVAISGTRTGDCSPAAVTPLK